MNTMKFLTLRLERDKKRAVANLETHIKEGLIHTLAAM